MSKDVFLKRFVVIVVMMVSSIIALSVILATILIPVFGTVDPPEELKNWGGLIIGFYFGTFVRLLKDWLAEERVNQEDSSAEVGSRQKGERNVGETVKGKLSEDSDNRKESTSEDV